MQSKPLRSWKLGVPASQGFPSLKSQVRQGHLRGNVFGKVRLESHIGIRAEHKVGPNSQHNSRDILYEIIEI